MHARRLCLFGLVLPLLFPLMARAGEPGAGKGPPTVVVRVRSLQTVIDNAKLLATIAGREGMAGQIEGLVKAKVGPKGFQGIDPDRPFGFYGRIGKELDDIAGVLMIPVADEQELLGLLENLGYPATKGKAGLYSVAAGPAEVHFRFANKYAYVTALNLEALDQGGLPEPGKVFPAGKGAAISAALRLDQVPQAAKFIIKAQVEQELEKARDQKQQGETPAQHEFRLRILDELTKRIDLILNEGAEASAELDVSKDKNEFAATFALSARPSTELAKEIQKAGQEKSLFGGFPKEGVAARGLLHFTMKEPVARAFEKMLLENAEKGVARISDEEKRRQAQGVVDALKPTLRAGEIDSALSLHGPGPGKHYALVAAFKLREGEKLAKTIREAVEQALKEAPPAEAAKVKLDAESAGDVKIHRIDAQAGYDAKTKEVFGENPLYVAFRPDAVFVAVGEDALAPLKKALGDRTAEASPALTFEVALARLAPLMKKQGQAKALEGLLKGDEEGTIRVTVTGGEALRAQLTTRLSVLRFMGEVARPKGKRSKDTDDDGR